MRQATFLDRDRVAPLGQNGGHDHCRFSGSDGHRADQDGCANSQERTAKYNRLMKIEAELGAKATFKGMDAYPLAST